MDRKKTLIFENASGEQVILNSPDITKWFELGARKGFTAPEIELVSQKFANGKTKIMKRILQPRTVSLVMLVIGNSCAERDRVFFEMVDRLMDVDGGETGKLYAKRSDGMTVHLNCAYSSGLSIAEQYEKYHRFTLEFYGADPWFYHDLPIASISLPTSARLALRDGVALGNHKLGDMSGTTTGFINNYGNEVIEPLIKVGRVRGSISITNSTTGNVLLLNGLNMEDDSQLIIDTRENSKSIYIINADGTRASAGQYLDWNNLDYSFDIVPGQNTINYSASAGSFVDTVTFEMSEKYLSA